MYGYSDTYHENLLKGLINSIKQGRNSHAYIFEGAKGLGKHEAARLFAAALTCTGEIVPCGKCPSCVQAKSNTNIDIIHVTAPKDRKTIGVDQIRTIATDAYVKPFAAPHKVYIIDDGDILTEQAQNGFLKILEEPPEYTVFIIVVTSSAPLLQTVLSRSVLIRFPELSESRILEYIKEKYPTEQYRANFLAKYSQGIPGVVDEIVASEVFEQMRQSCFDILTPIFSSNRLTAYDVSEFLENNKDNINLVLDFLSDFIRDIMFLQCGNTDDIINSDMINELRKKSVTISETTVVQALDAIIHARELLQRYISLKAVALNLAFKIKEAINP